MTARLPRDFIDLTSTALSGAPADTVAVLPLAAIEQHGPHLPLGTDVMIAETYLEAVKARLPDDLPALFLPVQTIGISTEHLGYAGTLTLPETVAVESWVSLGQSLARMGLRRLVMVSSHGGNSAAMSLAASMLRARHTMLAVTTGWHRFGAPEGLFAADELAHGIHGGAVETSIMLAARPDLVDMAKAKDFVSLGARLTRDNACLTAARPAPFAWMAQDLNEAGVVGNAAAASAEKGRALIAHGAAAFCKLLEEVAAFDLALLKDGPLQRP